MNAGSPKVSKVSNSDPFITQRSVSLSLFPSLNVFLILELQNSVTYVNTLQHDKGEEPFLKTKEECPYLSVYSSLLIFPFLYVTPSHHTITCTFITLNDKFKGGGLSAPGRSVLPSVANLRSSVFFSTVGHCGVNRNCRKGSETNEKK